MSRGARTYSGLALGDTSSLPALPPPPGLLLKGSGVLCVYIFPPVNRINFNPLPNGWSPLSSLIRSFSVLLAAEREVVGAQGDREIQGGQSGVGILPQKQRAKPKKSTSLFL